MLSLLKTVEILEVELDAFFFNCDLEATFEMYSVVQMSPLGLRMQVLTSVV